MRRRWIGLLLVLFLLATAPGCRVLTGAAIIVGEAFIEGALDDDSYDDDDDCDAPRKAKRPAPRRAQGAPRDPCR